MKPGLLRVACAGLVIGSGIVAIGSSAVGATDATSGVTTGQNAAPAFEDHDATGMTARNVGCSGWLASGNGDIGSWVVNLHSVQNRAAADDFAALARSQGIEVELRNVKIRGEQFWRIQVTGFPTADAARSYAGTTRKQLRLKEVWVMKRGN